MSDAKPHPIRETDGKGSQGRARAFGDENEECVEGRTTENKFPIFHRPQNITERKIRRCTTRDVSSQQFILREFDLWAKLLDR